MSSSTTSTSTAPPSSLETEAAHLSALVCAAASAGCSISLSEGQPVTVDQIDRLEAAMHALPETVKIPIPVEHRFAHGLYVRKAFFPAGSILVGETHNFSHLSILFSGRMLSNIDGVIRSIEGPFDAIAQPGTKRVGIAVTDVVWITAHGNPPDTQDVDAIEAWMLKPNPASGRGVRRPDQLDYDLMLAEFGFDPAQVEQQVRNERDRTALPDFWDGRVAVMPSGIDGSGLFARMSFAPGIVVAPSRIGGLRTVAGRYANHSLSSNAMMVLDPSGDIFLVATKRIEHGEEITTNYRQALELLGVKRKELQ